MALLDIVLTATDSSAIQEEARGSSGSVTDIDVGARDYVVQTLTLSTVTAGQTAHTFQS